MPADLSAAGVPHVPAEAMHALTALLREVGMARIAVPEAVAVELTGLSAKTLQRAAAEGQKTGRRRVGSRVVYYLPDLTEWIRSLPAS